VTEYDEAALAVSTEVFPIGDCDGVAISSNVAMPPPSNEGIAAAPLQDEEEGGAEAGDLLSEKRDARVIGHDAIHFPMYVNWQQLQVRYHLWNRITWAWRYASHAFGPGNPGGWFVLGETKGRNIHGAWVSYEAYHYMRMRSYGFPNSSFPDVTAWSQPTAWAYTSGSITCSFWYAWDGANQYPNLHTEQVCQWI